MDMPRFAKMLYARLPFLDRILRGFFYPRRVIRSERLQQYVRQANRPLVTTRVLVVMNKGIGNAIAATPLVQSIRTLWRRSHITILCPASDLFDEWCVVDRTVAREEELRGESFAHTFMTWTAIVPGSDTFCHLGKVHWPPRPLGLWVWLTQHESEQNMEMIRSLGYKGPTPPLYVSFREPEQSIPPSPLRVGLVPGGLPTHRWRNKRWPYFHLVAEALLARYADAQLCAIGGPDDQFPGALPTSARMVDLRGKLTLRETAWVLRHCHLAIGNDCGPMHIADAVMTPSMVLFGPTCAVKNGPLYRGVPVSLGVSCSPCQYHPSIRDTCEDPRCMTELTVDLVLRQVDRMLQARRSSEDRDA